MLRAALCAVCSAAAIAGMSLGTAACGSSSDSAAGFSNGSSPSAGADSGVEDGESDASPTDGASIDAASPPATNVMFLHASPSLNAIRLCWMKDGALLSPFPSDTQMPASNYSGIPVGGAATLSDQALSSTLTASELDLYALDAKLLAQLGLDPKTTCSDLLCAPGGPHCLHENMQYWKVGSLSPGQLRPGMNLVAIAGCLATALDPIAGLARCGSTWTPVQGNLHLDVSPLGQATALDAGTMFVQAAQLSPGLQSLGPATVSFGRQSGTLVPVAQLTHEGDLLPAFSVALALPGGLPTFGEYGFAVDSEAVEAGPAGHLWMSLAQAQELISPAIDPTQYYGAGSYIVAVLGDPTAPHAFGDATDSSYDGTGLHVLVLPTAIAP